MKTTPTKADWGRYSRWSQRFKTAKIPIQKEGELFLTLQRMEREHPELTNIPDKKRELEVAEKKRNVREILKEKEEEKEGVEEGKKAIDDAILPKLREKVKENQRREEESIQPTTGFPTTSPIEQDIHLNITLKVKLEFN